MNGETETELEAKPTQPESEKPIPREGQGPAFTYDVDAWDEAALD